MRVRILKLVLLTTILLPLQVNADATLGYDGPCSDIKDNTSPPWHTRCYNGTVTLENYDSIASIKARLKSALAWRLVESLVEFQSPAESGQVVSGAQVAALTAFLMSGGHLGWAHDVTADKSDIRFTGPVIAGTGFDTHQRVRLFYSDEVMHWLKHDRAGKIGNGAVIVKQMYASDPTETGYGADRVSGWAVMVKNDQLSHDGWIWYLFFFPKSPPYNAPLPVVYSQTGDSFCLSCHSAADNKELTFSAIENLKGVGQQYTWIDHAFPSLFSTQVDQQKHLLAGGRTVDSPASYASGVAQFQRAGILTDAEMAVFRAFEKSVLKNLKQTLEEHSSLESKQQLLNSFIEDQPTLANQQIPEGLLALLEKAIEEFATALKDKDFEGSMTFLLQDYWRMITQAQTTTPRSTPNAELIRSIGHDAKTTLKSGQAAFDWFPLDFIYSHTPALPAELPADICASNRGRLLAENPEHALEDCRDVYITADNCNGCHWSYVLQGNEMPYMVEIDPLQGLKPPVDHNRPNQQQWPEMSDYSPYNEWSASLMGLAGKDPVFLGQLSWEQQHRPEQADQISNFCLRCHQAGAQRQFHIDQGNTSNLAVINPPDTEIETPLFTEQFSLLEPSSKINVANKYGALARDGVTCTVCHTMLPDDLGQKSTFTAQFHYPESPEAIYGPYADEDIAPYYMQQAIGLTPKEGQHMTEAGLCGSCHTVITPILSDRSASAADEYRTTYEQTTFPEWLNSAYNPAYRGEPQGIEPQTCQQCHMPSHLPSAGSDSPLKSVVANVETQFLPDLPNRAADATLNLTEKPYRRHTLLGLNVFVNQMFQQFPQTLGNSMRNTGGVPAKPQLQLAEREMVKQGAQDTVDIEVKQVGESGNTLIAEVTVNNLTGHKFPSGVGFRRAFINLKAIGEHGDIIWQSGAVNSIGQIVDGNGKVLSSEMTKDPNLIPTGATTISQQNEVYIFESRLATPIKPGGGDDFSNLELTTSFLEIAKEVKDTRLLPVGWSAIGVYADVTRPLHIVADESGKHTEPYFPKEPGKRVIRYEIDTGGKAVTDLEATMIYQATPPYYLKDRLQYDTEALQRLYYMVANLQTEDTVIEDWSFRIKCSSATREICTHP